MRTLARAVGVLHTTTKAETISSFLLLEVGRRCTERQRSESERILRLQPFLAGATVRAVPDGQGGVRIEVETTDEIPTVFAMRFHGVSPSALRFGNANVGGQGLYLAAKVERGFAYRNGVGVYGVAHQVLGRPYTAAVTAERAPLGSTLTLALGHPFFTDLQRTAWHAGYGAVNRYVSFDRPEGDRLSLAVRRRFWDIGGVRRIGPSRRSAFVGALLTEEDVTPAERAVVVSDSGLVRDTSSALGGPIPSYRNLRLNAVVGVRALSFTTVRGFDALAAVQDVATGVQLGTLVGWGIPRFGSTGDNLFASADLYAGVGSATSFAAVRVEAEAREDQRTNRWDSMLGSGTPRLVREACRRAHVHRQRRVRRWVADAGPLPTEARRPAGRGAGLCRIAGRRRREKRRPPRGTVVLRYAQAARRSRARDLRRRRPGVGGGCALRGGQPNQGRGGGGAAGGRPTAVAAAVAPGLRLPGESGRPRALGGTPDRCLDAGLLAGAGRRDSRARGRCTVEDLRVAVRRAVAGLSLPLFFVIVMAVLATWRNCGR